MRYESSRSVYMSASDAERYRRPVEATSRKIVNKIHDLVMTNRNESEHNITHQNMNMEITVGCRACSQLIEYEIV